MRYERVVSGASVVFALAAAALGAASPKPVREPVQIEQASVETLQHDAPMVASRDFVRPPLPSPSVSIMVHPHIDRSSTPESPATTVRRAVVAHRKKPRPVVVHVQPVTSEPGCTAANWQSTLTYAESYIIKRESNFDVNSYNDIETSTGHAFGLGQLTTDNRVEYGSILGVSPDTTDPCAQLAMMRMYIKDRYGTEDDAMAWWESHQWY